MKTTRRSTAKAAHDAQMDPEFQALSTRQKRSIDKAFERGLASSSKGRKKRKITSEGIFSTAVTGVNEDDGVGFEVDDGGYEGEGGFLEGGEDYGAGSGGGFMPDTEEGDAGGFMEEDDNGDGGASMADGEVEPSSRVVSVIEDDDQRIPLTVLPRLLQSLRLPTDEDVLAVFRASASGWEADEDILGAGVRDRRKRDGADQDEGGVLLKDFRAVCAALMDPEGEVEGDAQDEDSGIDDDDEDAFQVEDAGDSSDLSDVSEESYGKTTKGKPSAKGRSKAADEDVGSKRKGRSKMKKLEVRGEKMRLSSRQKESVRAIWEMMKPPGKGDGKGRGGNVLGRDEVRAHVRSLGEMWTEDEITDMVSLFSTQHEARGLSLEDFGLVMLRAGLV